ncbi:MAG: hypothetical protein WC612_03135 [Bdellovibrionales bacterium]|jgi:hypothetical protein
MDVTGAMSTTTPKKRVYVPRELSLPEGSTIFGFALDEVPDLTVDDIVKRAVKIGAKPTQYDWHLLVRYGFDPEMPKKPQGGDSLLHYKTNAL